MDIYRAYVESQAEIADGEEVILNRTSAHAEIVICTIFSVSTRIVEVLSPRLDDKLWGRAIVIDAAIEFLRHHPEAILRVAVESKPTRGNSLFIDKIRASEFADKLKVFLVPKNVQSTYHCHFMVADGVHYRLETSVAETTSLGDMSLDSRDTAIVQFGRAEYGKKLRIIFAGIKARSKELAFQSETTPTPVRTATRAKSRKLTIAAQLA